jgi:hypothetical protein
MMIRLENTKCRDHFGDLSIDGRIILKLILKVGCGDVEMTQDMVLSWALCLR